MQDPLREITGVVKSLVECKDATEQQVTLQRYFLSNASFDHPLCRTPSYNGSRDLGILQTYQWLRVISNSTIVIHSAAFDDKTNQLFLDMTQTLRPRLTPFIERPARIVTVLFLQKGNDNLYYVQRQDDLYAVQIMPGKIFPGGEQVINFIKTLAGINIIMLSFVFAIVLGLWRPVAERKPKSVIR